MRDLHFIRQSFLFQLNYVHNVLTFVHFQWFAFDQLQTADVFVIVVH